MSKLPGHGDRNKRQRHSIKTRDKTKTDIIQYLHGYCFSPVQRIFLKVINNGNFLTWTGFNNQTLLKHLTPIIENSLGHLYQEQKNLQLMKQVKIRVGN